MQESDSTDKFPFFRYNTTFCLICTKFVQYPRVACFILLVAYGETSNKI